MLTASTSQEGLASSLAASMGPPSPIPSPSPSPSPLSSSSNSAASSPPTSQSSIAVIEQAGDLTLALPSGRPRPDSRLSTPIPPSVQQPPVFVKAPRAVSLESERESASRLVQQGAMQHAVHNPDPVHNAIPKNFPSDVTPLPPQESTRPNPLAPSLGPGMTPTPQTPPPVAPTPKISLSLSLGNLAKLTAAESPPHSPEGSS